MAGMLPGVEAARRRRIYHSVSASSAPTHTYTHRSSFSLLSPSSHPHRSSITNHVDHDQLGQLARQAKERLDERLRSQRHSLMLRSNSELSQERRDTREEMKERELRTEVYGSKKKKKLIGRWRKLGWKWKTWEQHECAVCLDEFKSGDNLVSLPCSHRFHSRCLVPWLHTSAHCPCCRMSIFS